MRGAILCALAVPAAALAPQQVSVRGASTRLAVQTPPGKTATNKMPEIPTALQEPGLKVPATAWKWPRSWPYGTDGFSKPEGEVEVIEGGAAVFDASAAEALAGHLVRHLEGDAVLEIDGTCSGASYIPEDGGEELWAPPGSVTKADAAALFGAAALPYGDRSFDAVVLYSAAELVTDPRATFRELWRVLKPGGRAIVAFSSARCSPASHASQQTQTWREYNDAQRLWVVGSCFHFSAGAPAAAMVASDAERAENLWGAGWRSLRGYDYFDAAEQGDENPLEKLQKALPKDGTPLFVVQADRAMPVGAGAGAAARADETLWNCEHMEEDDKRLATTRLLALLEASVADPAEREALAARAAATFPDLYRTLKPMNVVIATPLLAQFAANVAGAWDPASDAQQTCLKEGLGMKAPRETFWKPLGNVTGDLTVDDKLWLLADCVPHYKAMPDADTVPPALAALMRSSGDEGWDDTGVLPRAIAKIADRAPPAAGAGTGAAADKAASQRVQLLAVDLACREYLPDAFGSATLAEAAAKGDAFLAWLDALSPEKLGELADARADYLDGAKASAELAALDPVKAAAAAEDAARAKRVETMLTGILNNMDAEEGDKLKALMDVDAKNKDSVF